MYSKSPSKEAETRPDVSITLRDSRLEELEAALRREQASSAQLEQENTLIRKLNQQLEDTVVYEQAQIHVLGEKLTHLELMASGPADVANLTKQLQEAVAERIKETQHSNALAARVKELEADLHKEQLARTRSLSGTRTRAGSDAHSPSIHQAVFSPDKRVMNSELMNTKKELVDERLHRRAAEADKSELQAKVAHLEKLMDESRSRELRSNLCASGTSEQLMLQRQEQHHRIDDLEAEVRREKRDKMMAEEHRKTAMDQVAALEKQLAGLKGDFVQERSRRQLISNELDNQMVQRDMRFWEEHQGDDLANRQALQSKVIKKDLEVCDLQTQLHESLEKLQEARKHLIGKDQQILELQGLLANSNAGPDVIYQSMPALLSPKCRPAFEEYDRGLCPIRETSPQHMSQDGQPMIPAGISTAGSARAAAIPRFVTSGWVQSPSLSTRSPLPAQTHRSIPDPHPSPSPAMRNGASTTVTSQAGGFGPAWLGQNTQGTMQGRPGAPTAGCRVSRAAAAGTSPAPNQAMQHQQQLQSRWGMQAWWAAGSGSPKSARPPEERARQGSATFS